MKLLQNLQKQLSNYLKKTKKFIKSFESDFQLLAIPLIFFVAFLILVQINLLYRREISSQTINSFSFDTPLHPYPLLTTFTDPVISAQAAIILDDTNQIVLYSKNPNLHFSMASTTKVMTALTALDYFKLDDILTIYSDNIEGAVAGFHRGERVSFENLLYALLLPSANDAAYAIAENYPGGVPAFVAKMNEKATSYHLFNTSYADPAGLLDDNDFTTVVDLSHLASVAMKNKIFARVVGTKEKVITTEAGRMLYLQNLNRLLGTDGINGVKTGTTEGAGEVLITSKVKEGHTFIIVVMKSNNRFWDTQQLLSLVDNNLSYITPEP